MSRRQRELERRARDCLHGRRIVAARWRDFARRVRSTLSTPAVLAGSFAVGLCAGALGAAQARDTTDGGELRTTLGMLARMWLVNRLFHDAGAAADATAADSQVDA